MASAAASLASSSSAAAAAAAAGHAHHPLVVAQGDWTKNLVHLAKTAELRRHALTLQMHTAHILSAHASLDQKKKAIEDVKEQKNKLDSERTRLLQALRQVNEDRDKSDMLEETLNRECTTLQTKIQTITDGDYATAKTEVDALRSELGQPPLPSLQATIEEKSAQYLKELLAMQQNEKKRSASGGALDGQNPAKRPRGRPKGSKTTKHKGAAAGTPAPEAAMAGAGGEAQAPT